MVANIRIGWTTFKFPYDISYVRWSGHGDNADPDPAISEFIKDWNQRVRVA